MYTTTYRPAAGKATGTADHLERTVDDLADIVETLIQESAEFVCSLQFSEAEALAEVLAAHQHTSTAARLMHRWVLTEPDWGEDAEHSDTLRHWLTLSVDSDRLTSAER
jgi:hypothetical protein